MAFIVEQSVVAVLIPALRRWIMKFTSSVACSWIQVTIHNENGNTPIKLVVNEQNKQVVKIVEIGELSQDDSYPLGVDVEITECGGGEITVPFTVLFISAAVHEVWVKASTPSSVIVIVDNEEGGHLNVTILNQGNPVSKIDFWPKAKAQITYNDVDEVALTPDPSSPSARFSYDVGFFRDA